MDETTPNRGWSTCPVCKQRWLVTPQRDCFLPACGHYGDDTSEANPARPCWGCGYSHARSCDLVRRGASLTAPRYEVRSHDATGYRQWYVFDRRHGHVRQVYRSEADARAAATQWEAA